jgi:hypothetical protein
MKFNFKLLLALIGFCLLEANDNWNNLKVTWGINPFGSNNFVSLPREVGDALKKGKLTFFFLHLIRNRTDQESNPIRVRINAQNTGLIKVMKNTVLS